MNYKVEDRVVVNMGTKVKPYYFLGEISKIKGDLFRVVFDDKDEEYIKIESIVGLGVSALYDKEIDKEDLHKYLKKSKKENTFIPSKSDPRKGIVLIENESYNASNVRVTNFKDPIIVTDQRFNIGDRVALKEVIAIIVKKKIKYLKSTNGEYTDYFYKTDNGGKGSFIDVFENGQVPLKITFEKAKKIEKISNTVKLGKEIINGYKVETKKGPETIISDKRFEIGDKFKTTYKGNEYVCTISKIQMIKHIGVDCWRYNYQSGILRGWFLDITHNGKLEFIPLWIGDKHETIQEKW